MENPVVETRPTFSRLTESRTNRAWRAAIPVVVIVAALVALLGYLASNVSSSSQRAMAAERNAQDAREQLTGMQKQIASLQKDDAIAKSPGRTTVILESASKTAAKGKKKAAAATETPGAWAAATWGELPDGKSFLRVNAYGLLESRESGKSFHAWFVPQSGDPVDVGALEPDPNGNGFAMNTELPAVDQGKEVLLTNDADGAKKPGDVLAKAELPKLKPTQQVAPPPSAGEQQPGQAKSGTTSQQMHQSGAKTDTQAPAKTDTQPPAGEQGGK